MLGKVEAGLRGPRTGDKLAAIVALPPAIRKFPLPFFVNAALLRLADVFKNRLHSLFEVDV